MKTYLFLAMAPGESDKIFSYDELKKALILWLQSQSLTFVAHASRANSLISFFVVDFGGLEYTPNAEAIDAINEDFFCVVSDFINDKALN
jgi:hypothetical protein